MPSIGEDLYKIFLGDNTSSNMCTEYQEYKGNTGRTVLCAIHPTVISIQAEAGAKCKHHINRPVYGDSEEEQRAKRDDDEKMKATWEAGGCWIPYREHSLSRPEDEYGECIECNKNAPKGV